ncbi:MAG: endonuclease, partial [Alistipes sp.]|nr:endonuclease [Alistipes sp.]
MAQRYYSNYGGYTPRSKQQHNLVMTILDGALTLVSVVVALLLLVALIVPAIRPEYTWALPMLGLIAPVLYLSA